LKFRHQKQLTAAERSEILLLWNREYPAKLNYASLADFDRYLDALPGQSHILMIDEEGQICGWYFDFERDGERWFAIIIDSALQGKGLGTQMLDLAKANASELNGWVADHENDLKSNGEPYRSPLAFYLKNGFQQLPGIRLELDKLSAVKIRWRK